MIYIYKSYQQILYFYYFSKYSTRGHWSATEPLKKVLSQQILTNFTHIGQYITNQANYFQWKIFPICWQTSIPQYVFSICTHKLLFLSKLYLGWIPIKVQNTVIQYRHIFAETVTPPSRRLSIQRILFISSYQTYI